MPPAATQYTARMMSLKSIVNTGMPTSSRVECALSERAHAIDDGPVRVHPVTAVHVPAVNMRGDEVRDAGAVDFATRDVPDPDVAVVFSVVPVEFGRVLDVGAQTRQISGGKRVPKAVRAPVMLQRKRSAIDAGGIVIGVTP